MRPFNSAEIARAAGVPTDTLTAWQLRYGLFQSRRPKDRPPKGRITERTVADACVVRAIRALTERGIRARDAVQWCGEILPKHFEQILAGKRHAAVAEVRGIKLDLVLIAREICERLNPGAAVRIGKPPPPSEEEMLAEVERVERYMQTQTFRDRVAAFRAKVLARGTPTNWQEAAQALGLPFWIVRIGLDAEFEAARGQSVFRDLGKQIGISEQAT